MSIDMSHGLMVRASIQEFLPMLKGFREKLIPVACDKLVNISCEGIVSAAIYKKYRKGFKSLFPRNTGYLDYRRFDVLLQDSIWDWGWKYARHWAKKSEQSGSTEKDSLSCSVEITLALFPDGDITYILPFGSPEMIQRFSAFPEIQKFEYWDCSDKPNHISDEEWERRAAIWSRVDVPEKDGVFYRLLNIDQVDSPVPTASDLDQFLSDFRKIKVEYNAEMILTQLIYDDLLAQPRSEGSSLDSEDHFESIFKQTSLMSAEERQNGSDRWNQLLAAWDAEFPHTAAECLDMIYPKKNRKRKEL